MMKSLFVCTILLICCTVATAEVLDFEYGGTQHQETKESKDGTTEYLDEEDGFDVIRYPHEGLLLIKNTTTHQCFFATLDESVFIGNEDKPVYVKTGEASLVQQEPEDPLVFSEPGEIPEGIRPLTDPLGTANGCDDSFFVKAKNGGPNKRFFFRFFRLIIIFILRPYHYPCD